MSANPTVFVSFSQRDQTKVRELFAGLGIQRVDVWDYSDAGQELQAGESLKEALRAKIDSCDYFLAVISGHSIDLKISPAPVFEVRYAIESGKARDRVVPILLDNPPPQWASLYKELTDLVWLPITTNNDTEIEDAVRRICDRLSMPYTPPALLNPEVFFSGPFLREFRSKRLKNASFVQLRRCMNSAGQELLTAQENDKLWTRIKEAVISFFDGADHLEPDERFFYPGIIRGVAELQLLEFENAEQTFLRVTNTDHTEDEWLGLAFAGLGHTYFCLERFEDSVTAFQRAVDLLPGDKKVRVNYLTALAYAGGLILDDEIGELLEDKTLSAGERLKLSTMRGVISYKQGDYPCTIKAFENLNPDDLNETSSIYYAMALREYGYEERAIEVLKNAAHRIKTNNLYHHLAHAYLRIGATAEALVLYEQTLSLITSPSEFARQVLVEYAQLIKIVQGATTRYREACERVLNFTVLPPPQSKPDFFFTGFASYLLGKHELARFYFQSATGFASEYYDQLELTA